MKQLKVLNIYIYIFSKKCFQITCLTMRLHYSIFSTIRICVWFSIFVYFSLAGSITRDVLRPKMEHNIANVYYYFLS